MPWRVGWPRTPRRSGGDRPIATGGLLKRPTPRGIACTRRPSRKRSGLPGGPLRYIPIARSDHAALATLYELSGDAASYRGEAQVALELDRRMPHADKKLPEDLRRKLETAAVP